jgi:hypothetical protein
LRSIVGSKLRVISDEKGNVERVEGFKELTEKAGAQADPMTRQMIEGMVNEDAVKQIAGNQVGLPPRPVSQGDTWKADQEFGVGQMGKLKIAMDVTFTGWEEVDGKRCALLSHTGTITGTGSDSGTEQFSLAGVTGTTKGRTWFDVDAGLVRKGISDQDMKMKMPAMGENATVTMKQSVTNQLVSVTQAGQ